MTDLEISQELAAKLQQLARDKDKTLEDMLSDFVAQNQQNTVSADTMHQFAEELEKLDLHSEKNKNRAADNC